MKKRYNYVLARTLTVVTGVMFFTRAIIEALLSPIEGYEWVLTAFGALFLTAIIYSAVLIFLNAYRNKQAGE